MDSLNAALTDALFAQSRDALCLVAPEGTALRTNRAWLSYLGTSSEQTNRNIFTQCADELVRAAQACARQGSVVEIPRHVRHGSEHEIAWEGSVAPIPMDSGTGLLFTVHEVPSPAIKHAEDDPQRMRAVFGALVEGVLFFNVRGEVEQINEAVSSRYGFTLNELVDTDTDPRGRILRADGTPFPVEELPALVALRTGMPVRDVEMGVPLRDGSLRWRVVNALPVHDEHGRLIGSVASFFDITDRKRAEAALRDSEQQLREADRRKDEFLGMLSHELRNPLAPIRNALYILDHVDVASQQARRAKDVVNRQTMHLARLVDDLLDVTRITRGKVELRRVNLDLVALARRTVDDYRAVMRERGLDLIILVPEEPIIVNGDETRLAQVLGNLLSNAAKFTPAGGSVTLAMNKIGGNVVVHVRDTGVGIPRELLPTIFDPFVQARQTLARTEGGLGLGLALVKGLTELHGGRVGVTSVVDMGTDFTIELPLAPGEASVGQAKETRAAARTHRVLVVDDNVDAAQSLAELVRLFGHEVDVVYDGPSALTSVAANRPDVVLCDLGLPGMDGYEVAKALRAKLDGGIRLVAVSGYAQPEDIKKSIAAGFDAHLAKPPDPAHIERLFG